MAAKSTAVTINCSRREVTSVVTCRTLDGAADQPVWARAGASEHGLLL
jgi:hypothetical protein